LVKGAKGYEMPFAAWFSPTEEVDNIYLCRFLVLAKYIRASTPVNYSLAKNTGQ